MVGLGGLFCLPKKQNEGCVTKTDKGDIHETKLKSQYKADEARIHEMERDVTKLWEVLDIPPVLEHYINDYKIHVFEISWLTDEQAKLFQSDFRAVAEFFTQIRKNDEYKPTAIELKHVDEVLKLLAVFGEADRFAKLVNSGASKEVKTMCQAINKIEQNGIEKGIEKGIISLVEAMQELGQSNEAILHMIMKKFSL
ncbi:MAG: hypothetical protein IKV59_01765, partial [Lachnospiraceae bacterium]|nr:hypothetical protein [Lachnospiraceae bacterium]